jgi:hypothetical protein
MVNPLQLFSVAALDPARQPAKEASSYDKCEPKSRPAGPTDFLSGIGPPFFMALPPQYIWTQGAYTNVTFVASYLAAIT